MAVESALVGVFFLGVGIVVVGQKSLGGSHVDFALVLGHQLFPAHVARIGAQAHVFGVKVGLFEDEFFIHGEIGADDISIFLALQGHVFQSQLKTANFVVLHIREQPVVGVAAIVAFFHDAGKIVD